MTEIDKPVFLIAVRDGWLCLDVGPELNAALAFGSRDDAERYAAHTAERRGDPPSLYRVCQYNFSGRVSEA